MFWYFIPVINLCQRLFWDWELIKVINILFIGLVIFETKRWFLTLKLIWRSILFLILSRMTAHWDCSSIFPSHFLKKETAFYLLPASSTCLMHLQDSFGSFLSPSHVKHDLNSQNLSPIWKCRGNNSLMMTSIVRLSSKRSRMRTNQNAGITWAII